MASGGFSPAEQETKCVCPRNGNCPVKSPALPRARHFLDCLEHWARTDPGRACIIYYGTHHTYGMIARKSDALAARLRAMGVRPGDAVAVFLHNCPQYLVAVCGIAKAGGIVAPAYPQPGECDRDRFFALAAPRAVIADDVAWPYLAGQGYPPERILLTSLASALSGAPLWGAPDFLTCRPRVEGFAYLEDLEPAPPSPQACEPDSPGLYIFSSGTSGLPKLCAHSHKAMLLAGLNGIHCVTGAVPGDVGLVSNPMYWISGFTTAALIPLISGITHVLLARWNAPAAMRAIEACRVSFMACDVSCYRQVLSVTEPFDLSSLRHARASSFTGFINSDIREAWQRRTGIPLVSSPYGTTESHTLNTSALGVEETGRQPVEIFCGYPVRDTVIHILDPATGRSLPTGRVGEIALETPTLMLGYRMDAGVRERVPLGGIWRTGDLGRLDARGCLYLRGRIKDLIKVKGKSVSPAEVENALQVHPAVARCAVIGRDDAAYGQVPVAFVLLGPGQTVHDGELRAWCEKKLAHYKVPEVRVLDELPVTPAGKLKRAALAALL